MKTKLDLDHFNKVFPPVRPALETLRQYIKRETETFNDRVLNMVKLWDQKISTLRAELNIQGIYRKLNKFPEKEEIEKVKIEFRAADLQIQNNLRQVL